MFCAAFEKLALFGAVLCFPNYNVYTTEMIVVIVICSPFSSPGKFTLNKIFKKMIKKNLIFLRKTGE